MASLNKVLLIGSLGKDPEQRFMPNGNAVCNFSIATNETWKDKDGNKQEKVTWHNIVIFGKLAEIAAQYLKKGSQVYLEGRIENEKYQDKQTGQDRYTTKIVCDEMKMLGGKQEGNSQPSQPRQAQPAPSRAADPFEDEDLPFATCAELNDPLFARHNKGEW